ncbi:MAG: tetratricopeptide repeat protein [Turicibacter sp.]
MNIIRVFTAYLFSLIILGCASTVQNSDLEMIEKLLIASNNNDKLVEFYKKNLNINTCYRAKLVNIYLADGDLDSASQYAETYKDVDIVDVSLILARAKLHYAKGEQLLAETTLETYKDKSKADLEYYFLKGKLSASRRLFDEAVEHFEQSRRLGALDKDVKNNIAVIMIMQERFSEAVAILKSLYFLYPNDEKIEANLMIGLIRSGEYETALNVLSKKFNEKVAFASINRISALLENKVMAVGSDIESKGYTKNSNVNESLKKTTEVSQFSEDMSFNQNVNLYRIQILATKRKIDKIYFYKLRDKYGPVYIRNVDGLDKISIGEFNSKRDAVKFLKEVDVPGAFLVSDGLMYKEFTL